MGKGQASGTALRKKIVEWFKENARGEESELHFTNPFELIVAVIYTYIKSVSYPNSKADHLLKMSRKLLSDFNGKVPDNITDLMTLPGVGRKTANVVASICFNEPVIAVDTHVFRVAHRLGLSTGKTPYEVELDLEKLIDKEDRARAHHWLILHGRYVCKAQKPDCTNCGINHLCPKLMEGSKLSDGR